MNSFTTLLPSIQSQMADLKSRPCRDFLWLMDREEDPNYTECLNAVIESYRKDGHVIDREKLIEEINLYM